MYVEFLERVQEATKFHLTVANCAKIYERKKRLKERETG
jgi:hypothetical protein